ncbi:hypothetical protein [Cryobacterium sp. MLB-32]|uniref:hypothetical protein n=1 Tax=Cryobacterium sp. MLB-32 TaxID=1529318 RepID=UPI000A7E4F11|nr:hypothetical protein [Cryobacterium sp. MLB-32]
MKIFVSEIFAQSAQQDGWIMNGGGWFVLALINAGLAEQKNRSRLLWFLGSLVLGPLATLLIVVWGRVPDVPPVPPHPSSILEDRYQMVVGSLAVFTGGAFVVALIGQLWAVWVVGGVLAAGLVVFIVLYRRARAKRESTLTAVDHS